jgi:hypothetical protein
MKSESPYLLSAGETLSGKESATRLIVLFGVAHAKENRHGPLLLALVVPDGISNVRQLP